MVLKPHKLSLQKVDVTSKAVAEVLARTIEYLQPNPGKGVSCEGSAPASSGLCQSGIFQSKKRPWKDSQN